MHSTSCSCTPVVITLSRRGAAAAAADEGGSKRTCVKFPACRMCGLIRAIHAVHKPTGIGVFDYCECRGSGTVVSPTMMRLTSPLQVAVPDINPTEAAMVVLNTCMRIAAEEREAAATSEDGEEVAPPVGAATLYDLASDWMEHLGWTKLAASVPLSVKFAQAHPHLYNKLECACFALYSAFTGAIPGGPEFDACLKGVRAGVASVKCKRKRHGRRPIYEYTEPTMSEVADALIANDLYGSAHVLAEFVVQAHGANVRCVSLPVSAVDDLFGHLSYPGGGGVPGDKYCVMLTSESVFFVSSGDVIAKFLAGTPVRPLAGERGATNRCPMDAIIAGFLDGVNLVDVLQAGEATKKLISRNVATQPTVSPNSKRVRRSRKRPTPDTVSDDGDDATSKSSDSTPDPPQQQQPPPPPPPPPVPAVERDIVATAAHFMGLPGLLNSLYDRDVTGAMIALGSVWSMPDEAYYRDKDVGTDDPPAGIYLAPVWTSADRAGVTVKLSLDVAGDGTQMNCHGNLVSGLLAYLLPERLHQLDHFLVNTLEEATDQLCTLYDSDPPPPSTGGAELVYDSDLVDRISALPHGALKLAILAHKQQPEYAAHHRFTIRDPQVLEQYYMLCADPNIDCGIRRCLFCCVVVLANEVAGTYCAKFPLPLPRQWSHTDCAEHQPRGGDGDDTGMDPESRDAVLSASLAHADETAVFRAVIEALVIGGCQPVSKPPEGTDPESLIKGTERYGYSMLYNFSIPPVRSAKGVKRSDEGTAATASTTKKELQLEHMATLQMPYLDSCRRVLAFFLPDAVREKFMGHPCFSLSTPIVEEGEESPDTQPIGNLLLANAKQQPQHPKLVMGTLCGRFRATDNTGVCNWCRLAGSPERSLIVTPCRTCSRTGASPAPRYHANCIGVLGSLEPSCVAACPACLTPLPGSEAPATATTTDPFSTTMPGHRFINTIHSVSVDPTSKGLKPVPSVGWISKTPPVTCCVCKATRQVFAWTFLPTGTGTVRLDFDCKDCADIFDLSIDAQVAWAANPASYPLYTVGTNSWRRPFLKLATNPATR
jgi:hypothetical protein